MLDLLEDYILIIKLIVKCKLDQGGLTVWTRAKD